MASAVAVLFVAVLAFAVAVLAAAASDERAWAMESELDLRDRRLTSQNEDIGRLRSTLHRFTGWTRGNPGGEP